MIEITVKAKENGFLDIRADGHADSRICACVSTLLQSNVRYLQELSQQFPEEIQVRVEGGSKH